MATKKTDIYDEIRLARKDICSVDAVLHLLYKKVSYQDSKIIESQQHTIDYLTDALRGKYEHGLFIFMEEGKHTPTIIKDGQVLTDGYISSVDIFWDCSHAPNITIEHTCGG